MTISHAVRTQTIPVHESIDRVATESGDRIAVVSGDTRVSYRDLARQADQVAAALVAHGAGAERIVGVHLERSTAAIVALLGVLKAGSAYLPLPVNHPADRLRYLLDDAGADLVVTRTGLVDALPARKAVLIDRLAEVPPPQQWPAVRPDNLAYVIYTSGTTGRPKGVCVTHRGVANLVAPHQDYVHFGPDEVFLQLAPLAFDASAFEIWGALANGATLVLAAPSYDAIEDLPTVLAREGVTTLLLTPALFHVVQDTRPEVLDAVPRLIVGGDVMSVRHAHAHRARGANNSLRNVYGPTEASTLVSSFPVTTADERLPIGAPIAGARLHLLDAHGRPATEGEIHIGGVPVTRGYLNLPGLTSLRFVPDPFTDVPGARLYATGDSGVLDEHGRIVFTGRLDDQVKVRGHRIELQEVEQVLLDHADVRAAAVVHVRTPDGVDQLVAHLVSAAADTNIETEVAAHVAAILPDYLRPSRYVIRDHLPLTASGKVDRAVLADAPAGPEPRATGTTAPGAESTLAEIWQSVLGVPAVGPDDDFFALGGDSLLAIRVIAQAEERGLPLTLTTLFTTPVLRDACRELSGSAPVEQTTGTGTVYPATRLQLGLLYESLVSEGSLYVDFVSRRIDLPLHPDLLNEALHAMAVRHEILRTGFDLGGYDEPMQVVAAEPRLTATVEDLRGLDADEVALRHERMAETLSALFDPESAPLIRVHAAHLTENSFRLSFAFHHAILDGWSESMLLVELLTVYHGLLTGTPVELPPTAPFAEYVRQEQEVMRSQQCRDHFTGVLGTDPVVSSVQATGVRYQAKRLVPPAVARLAAENATRHGIPIKSQLVAAYCAAVSDLSGVDDSVVGLSVNGRIEGVGGDRTLGLFVNHVPIRLRMAGASWGSLARDALLAETQLLPYRRFPYQELEKLAGGRPFDMAFSYTHFHPQDELTELGIEFGDQEFRDHSSLPLRVEVYDTPDADGLVVEVSASRGHYGADYVNALADRMLWAIESVAASWDESVHH
ncbi:non-ribosomal peptide synthetase [Kibdelosporangium aridum]|uniref:Amino acid adenylation domain-containing protein n=1 Tax=Kibdelosporangium aridum TaxID=2030 RepID=A0A1W2FYF3_KIBAR|nr:amino acid adenylation domain-containing protein [Kibdelosporangium aridum]SMD26921.1 amino acid adenylation domain-containing protein [Kibdelosporangium aridum]